MTNIYTEDLCIMGNGIIGSLTALLAAKAGLKVSLCGPYTRPGSASVAAGAMLNVLGEIDGPLDDYGRRKLKIGRDAIAAWRQILPPHLFVADRTKVYLLRGAAQIERDCFDCMAAEAGGFQMDKHGRHIILEDELAVDTAKLFVWLENELRQCVRLLPNNSWQSGLMSMAPKTLWCAGVWTPKIMGPAAKGLLPLYSGIGTAMVLKNCKINVPERMVVRTPNRGNTCGLHVVPRGEDEWYVGAGSYISEEPTPGYRLETIRYLTDCVTAELDADIWRATVEPVVGYRPVSFDGKPMLGPLKAEPSYYVATGTKRDGLTYAPIIADDVIRWAAGTERTGVFDGWEPDRTPISYGPHARALSAYVANRRAALESHGRLADTMTLHDEWGRANARAIARYNLHPDFGIHPEIVAVMQ